MSPDKVMCKLCGDYVQLPSPQNTRQSTDEKEDHRKEKHPEKKIIECFPNV